MITFNYIYSLYSFAYRVIGMASQDLLRYSKCEWYDGVIGADLFHDDICNALVCSTNARNVMGV